MLRRLPALASFFGATRPALTGIGVASLGVSGPGSDVVPADYDGDGRADLSVKDTAASGVWYIDNASDGFGSWNFLRFVGA